MRRGRRRVVESDDDDEDDIDVDDSPIRRSPRLQRMRRSSQSGDSDASDDDEEDDESDIDDNNNNKNKNKNNNNRNNNNDDDEEEDESEGSDVIFDENKNDVEQDEESNESEEEDEGDKHPDYSLIFPTFISGLAPKYKKIEDDINDIALTRLIDTASSLAEYNSKEQNYDECTQRLESTMNKLLNLSKEIQIEQLMYDKLCESIREGQLENKDNENDNDINPVLSGDWDGFFNNSRNKILREIDTDDCKDIDNESARIKQSINNKKADYKQQLTEAIIIDEIEDPDSDNYDNDNNNNHNRNRNNNHGEDDDDDDDDDDIALIQDKTVNVAQIKCKLTMQIFKQPVKSKVCPHTFERDAIMAYIDNKVRAHELTECPLTGCTMILTKDGFVRDIKMEKLIKAQSKQQQDVESDDDQPMDLTTQIR